MLCQRCGKPSPNAAENCRACGFKLLALLPQAVDGPAEAREFLASEETHGPRVLAIEKLVRRASEEVEILIHAMEFLERSVTADRAGIHTLARMLREAGHLDGVEFHSRWLARAARNLSELALKDGFMERKDGFLGAYRGRSSKRFEERLNRAEDLFFLLDSAGALACLEEAVSLDPENLSLRGFLGECLLEKGDFATSRPHIEAAALVREPAPGAATAWARLLLAEGEAEKAAAYIEGRLKRNPPEGEFVILLSLARGLTEDWKACAEAAQRALRTQESPAALYLFAHALLRLGQAGAAESALESLLAFDSTCEDGLLQLALVHMARGRWSRARSTLERLQTLDPSRDAGAILAKFRGGDRKGRALSRILPLRAERVMEMMGSAQAEARLLLRQAESEIR